MAEAFDPALSPGAVPEPTNVAKPQETWKENLNLHLICPECKEVPPRLVEEFSAGDMVCATCGLVLGDKLVDTRSEWRTFSNDDNGNHDPSRVGDVANPLLNGSQLQTTISSSGTGSNVQSRDLHRAQNKSTHDKPTKGLLAAYRDIGAFCDGMRTSKNVSDTAKQLFKITRDAGPKTLNRKTLNRKPREVIIAGCIYIACRQCHVPRTFREINVWTKVSRAEIGRAFKLLEELFVARNKEKMDRVVQADGIVNPEDMYTFAALTTPDELCIRFCNQLGLDHRCTIMSEELARKTGEIGKLGGRSPLSIAGACIYMASHLVGQPKSTKEISAIAGAGEGTIRSAYKLIYPDHEEYVDSKWVQEGKANLSELPPP